MANNYSGHMTHKYDNIRIKDYYQFQGMKHVLLTNAPLIPQYIVREDGEVFSYDPKTGNMKRKAQMFHESGGVKNKARRAMGKPGGSVYKTVNLWGKQFLTHKLLGMYVQSDEAYVYYKATGNKDLVVTTRNKVSKKFYKGQMPVGYEKRCYKAK